MQTQPAPSKIDLVYAELERRIICGDLKPGDVIDRRTVAREMDVSVSPVGEAMIRLEFEGLLERRPRKGTSVRRPEPGEIADRLILRLAIECQAARLACGEPVRAQRATLEQLAGDIDEGECRTPEGIARDIAFHRAIVACAGSPSLLRTFEQVVRPGLFLAVGLLVEWETSAPPEGRRQRVKASHRDLLRVLMRSDPDAAESAIRRALTAGREALLASEVRRCAGPTQP